MAAVADVAAARRARAVARRRARARRRATRRCPSSHPPDLVAAAHTRAAPFPRRASPIPRSRRRSRATAPRAGRRRAGPAPRARRARRARRRAEPVAGRRRRCAPSRAACARRRRRAPRRAGCARPELSAPAAPAPASSPRWPAPSSCSRSPATSASIPTSPARAIAACRCRRGRGSPTRRPSSSGVRDPTRCGRCSPSWPTSPTRRRPGARRRCGPRPVASRGASTPRSGAARAPAGVVVRAGTVHAGPARVDVTYALRRPRHRHPPLRLGLRPGLAARRRARRPPALPMSIFDTWPARARRAPSPLRLRRARRPARRPAPGDRPGRLPVRVLGGARRGAGGA